MDALVERLDTKLREWTPGTAEQVRQRIVEIIDLADHDALRCFTVSSRGTGSVGPPR